MDGGLIASIVGSGVVVAGSIGSGFWALSNQLGKHGKEIGKLQGEVSGFKETVTATCVGLDTRIARLEDVENGNRLRKRMKEE